MSLQSEARLTAALKTLKLQLEERAEKDRRKLQESAAEVASSLEQLVLCNNKCRLSCRLKHSLKKKCSGCGVILLYFYLHVIFSGI
jgi:hypothetical protein